MAALVQSFPQQTSTVTILQTRPTSASGILQTSQGHQFAAGQIHQNGYNGMNGSGPTTYRGQGSVAPIAPYAFTSTPSLTKSGDRVSQGPHTRNDQRTNPSPTTQTSEVGQSSSRTRYPAAASVSTTSSSSSSELSSGIHQNGTQDDTAITSVARVATRVTRPQSTTIATAPASPLSPNVTASKSSPDRYRRPAHRRAETTGQITTNLHAFPLGSAQPSGSGMAAVSHLYIQPSQTNNMHTGSGRHDQFPQLPSFQFSSANRASALHSNPFRATVDDMHLNRQPARDEASRYRRRSIHTLDINEFAAAQLRGLGQQGPNFSTDGGRDYPNTQKNALAMSNRPASSPGHSGNSENRLSARKDQLLLNSVSKREPNIFTATSQPISPVSTAAEETALKHDHPHLVNIPPRSSSDAAKRAANPSPLSKPMMTSPEHSVSKDSFASAVNAVLQQPQKNESTSSVQGSRPSTPAAQQLAALNDKESKKSKTSRLRRAFSFGSAAELRRISAENNAAKEASGALERSKLRKDKHQTEDDVEQARIAQKQEEAGIGNGIYSGQGNIFSGSTDNLSISSTASSASIMIRKMGQGMKKSTRSLVGLFRPKSVIGASSMDSTTSAPVPSLAQVSMVNVEAERERDNSIPNSYNRPIGGTGFPKLEGSFVDVGNVNNTAHGRSGSSDTSTPRKGCEKDRAEVLKRGILKRSGTDSGSCSPVVRPVDKNASFNPPTILQMNDSPTSSAPSTPNDESQIHKRTVSVSLAGEEFFVGALNLRGDSKSVPGTPPTHPTLKRNATFSPRIQFHDTWPSGEYDRRGDIATCNRLTPMLAQQIKEELNSFKMEMEVHENSKIYTHFF